MLKKIPLYREALGRSWQLLWEHKLLWVFGLFAAFLGQLGILEILVNVTYASSDYGLYPRWLAIPKFWDWSQMASSLHVAPGQTIWVVLLFFMLAGLGAAMLFAALVSQGALIKSAAQSARRGSVPHAGKAWHAGVAHVWRLFFIQVCKKFVLLLVMVAVGWATLNAAVEATTSMADILLFFSVFLLAIFVGIVISFLAVYAACYVVVEEYSLFKALESAWRLWLDHWLVSFEVGFVILFLNAAAAVAAIVGFFLCFLPTILLWAAASAFFSRFLFLAALAIGLILFTLFIFWLGSVLTVYTTTTWTYLYMKMHKEGIVSRIVHWLK